MTAFATANIPANVDTLEKLIVWACGAFYSLHRFTEYKESDLTGLIPIITAQDGVAADKSERVIFRVAMPLNPEWRESATKIFQEAQVVSSAPIPAAYLP